MQMELRSPGISNAYVNKFICMYVYGFHYLHEYMYYMNICSVFARRWRFRAGCLVDFPANVEKLNLNPFT